MSLASFYWNFGHQKSGHAGLNFCLFFGWFNYYDIQLLLMIVHFRIVAQVQQKCTNYYVLVHTTWSQPCFIGCRIGVLPVEQRCHATRTTRFSWLLIDSRAPKNQISWNCNQSFSSPREYVKFWEIKDQMLAEIDNL